jgi:hypothetical protein
MLHSRLRGSGRSRLLVSADAWRVKSIAIHIVAIPRYNMAICK